MISFPPSTKMLHFEGLLHITVLSQIHGSKTACVYPWRFAACRVALRAQAKPSTKWRNMHMSFHAAVLLGTTTSELSLSISCSLRTREIRIRSSAFMEIQRLLRTCVSGSAASLRACARRRRTNASPKRGTRPSPVGGMRMNL